MLSISTDACCLVITLDVQLCTQRDMVDWAWVSVAQSIGVSRYTRFHDKKHLKNVGPIHHCEPPHANSPDVASGTVARRLRIDVDDANDNDDNDNAWQRGPLWPNKMGSIILAYSSRQSTLTWPLGRFSWPTRTYQVGVWYVNMVVTWLIYRKLTGLEWKINN